MLNRSETPGYSEIRERIRRRLAADEFLYGQREALDLLCIAIAATAHDRVEDFLRRFPETMRETFRDLMQEVEQNWAYEVEMVRAATVCEAIAAMERGVPWHTADDAVNHKLAQDLFRLSSGP